MKKLYVFVFLLLGIFSCRKSPTEINNPSSLSVNSLFAINRNNSVTLSWTNVINGNAFDIEIHRSDEENFSPSRNTRFGLVGGSETTFLDTTAKNNISYYYRIVPYQKINDKEIAGKPSNVVLAKPFNYDSNFAINYSEHIQRIFTSSCAVEACHEGTTENKFFRKGIGNVPYHGGQFPLDNWENVINGGKQGNFIIPYHADRSDLIAHTNTDSNFAPVVADSVSHMPQGKVSLPMNQVRLLAQWINEGAKNDEGDVPFSYSPDGKMYVVNAEADLIAVIDIRTQKLIRYVNLASTFNPPTTFGAPHHVKVDPQHRFFYVTLIVLGEVWQYSIDSNKFVSKVQNLVSPADLAISPSGDTIYAASFNTSGNGKVYVLGSTPTLHEIAPPIDLGQFATTPHGLGLTHDGQRLYVTNTTSGTLSEISISDFSVQTRSLDTIFTLQHRPYDPYLLELSEDDRFIWVTCKGDSSVRMFDRTISEEHSTKIISVGSRPLHPDIPPGETEMWVCNSGSDDITIVNLSDYSKITLPNVGRQPHDVEFTPDGKFGFLTLENVSSPDPPHHPLAGGKGTSFVIIYDALTRQVKKTIEVAGWSQNCAFAPASSN